MYSRKPQTYAAYLLYVLDACSLESIVPPIVFRQGDNLYDYYGQRLIYPFVYECDFLI